MDAIINSLLHTPEILIAVLTVLGGQKGYEIYRRKRFSNDGHDRRSGHNHNSFSDGDKDFVRECFETQTKDMSASMENDRLKLVISLSNVVREEGGKTRSAMRSIVKE